MGCVCWALPRQLGFVSCFAVGAKFFSALSSQALPAMWTNKKIQKYSRQVRCYCYGWALSSRLCFVTVLLNPQRGFLEDCEQQCLPFVPQGCAARGDLLKTPCCVSVSQMFITSLQL